MPRGRQYYDPIEQVPSSVEGESDVSRIELFPVGQDSTSRLPEDIGKWVGRKVERDGSVSGHTPGDFVHDRALKQAQDTWPGLGVYELRSEIEDSTWEGVGPSPRIWQNTSPVTAVPDRIYPDLTPAGDSPDPEQAQLRNLPIDEPGVYVRLADILSLLELWAVAYEVDKNPSAAMALREAVDTLKDVG